MAWTGFIWIGIANNEEMLHTLYEVFGVRKFCGVCWVAAEVLVCQEGLYCT